MRRSLVAVTCLLMLMLMLMLSLNVWLAPANAQDATPAATPDAVASPAADCVAGTEDSNAAVARQWEAVWGNEDDAALEDLSQPDIIHHVGGAGDISNVADLRSRVQVFATAFSDHTLTVDEVIADGDYVVIRWTASGTQTGSFFDLAPSGVQATWTGINIFRFECGLVAESLNEFDGVGLRAQLTGMADPVAGDMATPAGTSTPTADCAPTTEQDAADVATRWTDVWDSGDVDLLNELAAPASTHH